jgi:hypothetical protein
VAPIRKKEDVMTMTCLRPTKPEKSFPIILRGISVLMDYLEEKAKRTTGTTKGTRGRVSDRSERRRRRKRRRSIRSTRRIRSTRNITKEVKDRRMGNLARRKGDSRRSERLQMRMKKSLLGTRMLPCMKRKKKRFGLKRVRKMMLIWNE